MAEIERITEDDLTQLLTDVGPVPMQVGAVLLLDTGGSFDPERARTTLGARIRAVPRLRQRLRRAGFGCGRPVWVDDAGFDLDRHVSTLPCPDPAGDAELLDVAARIVTTPLPRDRPLWSATFVTGLAGERTALVITFHHVLADGIGGLAILASLVDGVAAEAPDARGFPRPAPTRRALCLDALGARAAAVRRLPAAVREIGAAAAELRPGGRRTSVAPCSLNRPTGPRRAFRVVRADLDAVAEAAHRQGATVNDVVLTAVGGALGALLAGRGEEIDRFVVSVPVSARAGTDASSLGNQVGVMPVGIPARGPVQDRLAEVARSTRRHKSAPRGASRAVVGPLFRGLARIGAFRWFINHQRLVHTFTTNVRGPGTALTFTGARIADVYATAVVTGNVTVSCAVLSYAGTLAVTVVADPDACPDHDVLAHALEEELGALVGRAQGPELTRSRRRGPKPAP